MSTPQQAEAGGAGSADARGRGRLVLADGVVEKIAGQVVSEIGVAYGTSGGFLGLGTHADAAAPAKVSVNLREDSAEIEVQAGIAYPMSIRQAAAEIRSAVVGRVQDLTGVSVRRVDVEVGFLYVPGAGASSAAESTTAKENLR